MKTLAKITLLLFLMPLKAFSIVLAIIIFLVRVSLLFAVHDAINISNAILHWYNNKLQKL